MTDKHGIFDLIMFAVLLVLPLIEWRWSWPRYLARLAAGIPGTRMRHFRSLILWEWVLTLYLAAVWIGLRRPWSSLMLAGSSPLRLGIGLVFAGLLAGFMWLQRRAILARPESVERMRARLKYAEPLLPHTPAERVAFWFVSASAGICEEILFRGFLTWCLAIWTGPIAAMILSSLIFGLGHIYLGLAHVPRTALVGLFLALVVYASGSLWPAILLHAAMDWNSGELGFRMLGAARDDFGARGPAGAD